MLIDTFSQFIETIKIRNIHYLLHSQYRDQLFIQALHQNENKKYIPFNSKFSQATNTAMLVNLLLNHIQERTYLYRI